uniref:Uncharacterized protein n=1 Tax=Globisporangium ultimum (strain ATCC 200006 / CBS 805.95 / DAOM BR144) TaxID=431595 RepID=K3W7M7_GLOUD
MNISFSSTQQLPIMQHVPTHVDILQCAYPSKRCEHLRAVKRDGSLHRFCEHHRVIANRNQKRLQQRRRIQRRASQHPYAKVAIAGLQTQQQLHTRQVDEYEHIELPNMASNFECQMPIELSKEDLQTLEVILVGEDIGLLDLFSLPMDFWISRRP